MSTKYTPELLNVREILHYSIITGQFFWNKSAPRVKIGDVAGTLNARNYRQIMISGKMYQAHRLAWFWVTGKWPTYEVDHKNGIKNANQWLNLREATHSQNNCNKGIRSDNTSGYKGVSWNKRDKNWKAQIKSNGVYKNLGCYETPELANEIRIKASQELHGDFARDAIAKALGEQA